MFIVAQGLGALGAMALMQWLLNPEQAVGEAQPAIGTMTGDEHAHRLE
jgi:hypothetical protein